MPFDKQILVVIDPKDSDELALHRGQLIAKRLGCAINLLWLGRDDEPVIRLVKQLQAEGLSASYQCCMKKALLETLQALWQTQHFGLLIKTCDPRTHNFTTSADAHLLRELPCPVLLVKHDSSWQSGVVVGAADPLSESVEQRSLNRGVMGLAKEVALLTNAELRVAVATPSAMMAANPALQSEAMIQARAKEAMQQQLADLSIEVGDIDVGEGPPEYWVPQVANQLNASVVVIGTRARGGIKGALIGNTAERILHRLNADVLVLRTGVSDQILPVIKS
ncbi:universal stress protein [Amphritea balenae]|uniref:UspA domain-containing protein n=1 Tax=Amphritea balenae TaxID=452629 RepID=A0A3P1SR68_9GAMM|nr:universal stress protein [Amphritea balenae]RRC99647.1 hypothetical protein EHS89_09110 [Amphritea balenae]GGK78674.1 hypothetical protein GCM10007941_31120 [Amphritea balenae]